MYRLPRALTLRQQHAYLRRPRAQAIPRIQRRWKSHTMYDQATGEPVRVQAVRFQKHPLTLRRIATIGIYTGIVYGYLHLLLRQMDVEIEFVEDEGEALADQQDDVQDMDDPDGPLYADDESTFIPLTWSTKLPRTFYRGSDPEWQEFIKVARDQPRHRRIQDELVQIVFTGSTQHASISRQLGKDAKVGKYWLDISFPDGPPQEYERSGIEIGDGYVAWSTQKVDAEKQWRVQRALFPMAAADGAWTTLKVMTGIQWRRVKQALGWDDVDPHSPEERYRFALEMAQQRREQDMGKSSSKQQTEPDAVVSASNPSASSRAAAWDKDRKELPWHIPVVPLPPSSASSDLPIAMHVFSQTMTKQWNPKKMEPPRGSFVVQGLVEVRGNRGRMLFDVQSCYDPKASKFMNVNANVRGYKRWRQSPRGGP